MVTHRAAKAIGDKLGVDWTKIPLEQLRQGIEVEWDEHQDVHHGDANIAAKIALAHLKERPDYYDHLKILERYGCEPRAKVRTIRAPPPPHREHRLKQRMPRKLPIAMYRGKKFYVDERLGQIRAVDNPHEFYDIAVLKEPRMRRLRE